MTSQETVEFIGGPYDGYCHQVSSMPSGIFEQAALPVSANLIRAVTGEEHGPLLPCQRVAIYKLYQAPKVWQYHFVGEMAAEPSAIDN